MRSLPAVLSALAACSAVSIWCIGGGVTPPLPATPSADAPPAPNPPGTAREDPLDSGMVSAGQWTAASQEFRHDSTAVFHPHGDQVCASGCAVSRHPTPRLTTALYHDLLQRFSVEPMDESASAFETLLYYGRQTRRLLDTVGPGPLDSERAAELRRELFRSQVRVGVRVKDVRGGERAWLDSARVPLDRRHVFQLATRGVQPLVVSGTVKRVGLRHLWMRL